MLYAYGDPKLKNVKSNLEDFFIVGPLQFEKAMAQEIQEAQSWILASDGRPTAHTIEVVQIRKGGIEIQAPWDEGLQLVHHLKSPVRVLWRWKSKKISHVSELKTWLRGMRPQDLIPGGLQLKIQSRKSRLQNEKMIERVFREDWKLVQDEASQTLFVDVYDDQFTLSWDLCGDPLFKRGWATKKGEAPLRENLAALLLRDLTEGFTGPELQKMTLVDPMMGSGTFLWESLGWNKLSLEREFAYQEWKGIPAFLKTSWGKNSHRPQRALFGDHWGFDQNPRMLEVAQENATFFKGAQLQLERRDVLEKAARPIGESLLISNPPYGERLEVKSIEKLIQAALQSYQPLRALVIAPRGLTLDIKGYDFKVLKDFLQGGLEVSSYGFSRSR